MATSQPGEQDLPALAEDQPVTMPDLPATLTINTVEQLKAIGDKTRWRILDIIQHQPATAKQIADTLKIAPGTITHHLQVLEATGMVQVVARRLVRGIVAKYYTRTARIFDFDFPPEIKGHMSISLDMLTNARDALAESLAQQADDAMTKTAFPRIRLSADRAQVYADRLKALVDDFLNEPSDPDGQIYGLCVAFFRTVSYALPPDPDEPGQDE